MITVLRCMIISQLRGICITYIHLTNMHNYRQLSKTETAQDNSCIVNVTETERLHKSG